MHNTSPWAKTRFFQVQIAIVRSRQAQLLSHHAKVLKVNPCFSLYISHQAKTLVLQAKIDETSHINPLFLPLQVISHFMHFLYFLVAKDSNNHLTTWIWSSLLYEITGI
jgi:hypothetical protein